MIVSSSISDEASGSTVSGTISAMIVSGSISDAGFVSTVSGTISAMIVSGSISDAVFVSTVSGTISALTVSGSISDAVSGSDSTSSSWRISAGILSGVFPQCLLLLSLLVPLSNKAVTFGVNFTDISGGCEIMIVGVLNPPSSTMSRKLKVGVFTFPASSILSWKLKVGVFILVPSGICSSWDSSSLSKVSFLGSSWTLS